MPTAYHAAEWLATADALRTVRAQLYDMIKAGHALPDWSGVSTILVHGLTVALALENLAQCLAESNGNRPAS